VSGASDTLPKYTKQSGAENPVRCV